ncbi:hypothetical protein RCOM_1214090 [Ricinus communis]|uniref:starch synthase n=1 Tax=Ricinus communis TaxID=3988 RepID=B9SF48_RICCO|nr:hypothetical protein RCOM_1214090 [Ricinus communis]
MVWEMLWLVLAKHCKKEDSSWKSFCLNMIACNMMYIQEFQRTAGLFSDIPLLFLICYGGVLNFLSLECPIFEFSSQGGRGLHSTLNFHAKKFIGILNGIDTDSWNPVTDTCLKVQYGANDLQGKAENKLPTRRLLGLSTADARQPLEGCITRLVPQKYKERWSWEVSIYFLAQAQLHHIQGINSLTLQCS